MSKYKHKIIDGHTKIFWNRKFKEVKEWQEQQLERGETLINPIRTKQDLIDTWVTLKEEDSTDITKDLKYNIKYETKYSEARAFRKSRLIENNVLENTTVPATNKKKSLLVSLVALLVMVASLVVIFTILGGSISWFAFGGN